MPTSDPTVRVKICGLTTLDDARAALAAGADYLGFILYAKSPRYIAPDRLGELLTALDLPRTAPHARSVGVFVNVPSTDVLATLAATGLHLAQLHGDESVAERGAVGSRGYKALRPADTTAADTTAADATAATAYLLPAPSDVPHLLIDAYHPSAYGGTGHRANWDAAAELCRRVPRLLLAGGLTPDNVAAAVAAVAPWGVDVASGVEAAPGRKDHAKVAAFTAAAKAISRSP